MDESAFEAHIAGWLVDYGGYRRVKVGNLGAELSDFDPAVGVDTADLFEYISATQPVGSGIRLVNSLAMAVMCARLGWGL